MGDNDNLKDVWQTLRDEGYETPEYEEFSKDMQDEENLKQVHQTLKDAGYTPPEYEQFYQDMGFSRNETPQETVMTEGEHQVKEIKNEKKEKDEQEKAKMSDAQKQKMLNSTSSMMGGISAVNNAISQQVQERTNYDKKHAEGFATPTKLGQDPTAKVRGIEGVETPLDEYLAPTGEIVNSKETAQAIARQENKTRLAREEFVRQFNDEADAFVDALMGGKGAEDAEKARQESFKDTDYQNALKYAGDNPGWLTAMTKKINKQQGENLEEYKTEKFKQIQDLTGYPYEHFTGLQKVEQEEPNEKTKALEKAQWLYNANKTEEGREYVKKIKDWSKRTGIPEDALNEEMAARLYGKYESDLTQTLIDTYKPATKFDYVIGKAFNESTLGSLWSMTAETTDQRALQLEAYQEYEDDNNISDALKVTASGLSFGIDAAPLALTGGIGGGLAALTRQGMMKTVSYLAGMGFSRPMISNIVVRAATNSGVSFFGTKILPQLIQGTTSLSLYNGISALLMQSSLGEIDYGEIRKEMARGAGMGAAFSIGGIFGEGISNITSKAFSNFGKGVQRAVAVGNKGITFGIESGLFAGFDQISKYLDNEETDSFGAAYVKGLMTNAIFKVTSPHGISKVLNFGKDVNTAIKNKNTKPLEKYLDSPVEGVKFTKEELEEISKSSGINNFFKNLLSMDSSSRSVYFARRNPDDARYQIKNEGNEEYQKKREELEDSYRKVLNDPNVSWTTKQKLALMFGAPMDATAPEAKYFDFEDNVLVVKDENDMVITRKTYKSEDAARDAAEKYNNEIVDDDIQHSGLSNNITWDEVHSAIRATGVSEREFSESKARVAKAERARAELNKAQYSNASTEEINEATEAYIAAKASLREVDKQVLNTYIELTTKALKPSEIKEQIEKAKESKDSKIIPEISPEEIILKEAEDRLNEISPIHVNIVRQRLAMGDLSFFKGWRGEQAIRNYIDAYESLSIRNAFEAGSDMDSEAERDAARIHYVKTLQDLEQAQDKFPEGFKESLYSDSDKALKSLRDNGCSNEDYALAKKSALAMEAYKGAMAKQVEIAQEEAEKATRERAFRNEAGEKTDRVIQGFTQDKRNVDIIAGNVALMKKGNQVDVRNSDSAILVRYEDGTIEQVSPNDILAIDGEYELESLVSDAVFWAELNTQWAQDKAYKQAYNEEHYSRLPYGEQQKRYDQAVQAIKDEMRKYFDSSEEAEKKAQTFIELIEKEGGIDELREAVESNNPEYENFGEEDIKRAEEYLQAKEELDKAKAESKSEENETPQVQTQKPPTQESALDKIPKDDKGNPIFEQAETPDIAYDAIMESVGGKTGDAEKFAAVKLSRAKKALQEAQKQTKKELEVADDADDDAIFAAIRKQNEENAEIEKSIQDAKDLVNFWENVLTSPERRAKAAEEAKRKEEEEKKKKAAEEAKKKKAEEELLNGVPDILNDTPAQYQARGVKNVSGVAVVRQKPIEKIAIGKETQVQFTKERKIDPKGNLALIEADELQPSHLQGKVNHKTFLAAQPKDRTNDISAAAERKYAKDIDPSKVTGSENAYLGSAPTVNERGEVIQGNNRSGALKLMYDEYPESVEKYKAYLKEHAAEFGLTPEDIDKFKNPVLVNRVRVSDKEAAVLGAYRAEDIETGGKRRIRSKETLMKMSEDNQNDFVRRLFAPIENNPDATLAELVNQNGESVLNFLRNNHLITDDEYASAFEEGGRLTAEAKEDIKNILVDSIFEGDEWTKNYVDSSKFPIKAQRAILATAFRDLRIDDPDQKLVPEIRNAIRAFDYLINQSKDFANAKNVEAARAAIKNWLKTQDVFDNTQEKISNFALELAALFKGAKQSEIQDKITRIYDLVAKPKGGDQLDMFNEGGKTLDEAIKEVLGIDYERQKRSGLLGGDNAGRPKGGQEIGENPPTGESKPKGGESADNTRGTTRLSESERKARTEEIDKRLEELRKSLEDKDISEEKKAEVRDEIAKLEKEREELAKQAESSEADEGEKPKGEEESNKPATDEEIREKAEQEENPSERIKEIDKRKEEIEKELEKSPDALKRKELIAERNELDKERDYLDERIKREEEEANRELTHEEIDALPNNEELGIDEYTKGLAKDFLDGDTNPFAEMAYQTIKEYARDKSRNSKQDSGNADGTLVGEAANGGERPTGGEQGGGEYGNVDNPPNEGTESAGVGPSGTNGKGGMATPTGEKGDNGVPEPEPKPVGEDNGGARPPRRGGNSGKGATVGSSGGGKGAGKGVPKKNGIGRGKTESKEDYNKRLREEAERLKKEAKKGILDSLKDIAKDPLGVKESLKSDKLNASIFPLAGLGMKTAKLISNCGKYGYALVLEGYCKFDDWLRQMRNDLYKYIKDNTGISDEDVDNFLRAAWNSKMEIDGVRKTIADWAEQMNLDRLRELARMTIKEKRKLQQQAESYEVKLCDLANIEKTLPFLLPDQQKDVLRAETQFADPTHKDDAHANGKGYMFTNGTGTGKTYTGLGIVKRALKSGKEKILIVTPNQPKNVDWQNDAKNLGIDAKILENTKDRGQKGVSITTYANLFQNYEILKDVYDLIVYDECHNLQQNKNGTANARVESHYEISNRDPEQAIRRKYEPTELWRRGRELKKEEKRLSDLIAKYASPDPDVKAGVEDEVRDIGGFDVLVDSLRRVASERKANAEEQERIIESELANPEKVREAQKDVDKTKVVFLSATPFNTALDLDYAESYIFKYPSPELEREKRRAKFLVETFGSTYEKSSSGKISKNLSDPEQASEEEVAFSDRLQNDTQTMSGRVLDSEYDYSREFPKLDFDKAGVFNEAMEALMNGKYSALKKYFKVFSEYNPQTAFFEVIKARYVVDRIKEHIEQGRKIAVYYTRESSVFDITNPFEQGLVAVRDDDNASPMVKNLAADFAAHFSTLLEWEKTLDYSYPSEQVLRSFASPEELAEYDKKMAEWYPKYLKGLVKEKSKPRIKSKSVAEYNGSVSDSERSRLLNAFNDDNSDLKVIVVQVQAGKEGISLHDTTGKMQRVLINLSLPQSPIDFIQTEGRIYRVGNKSNAIFETPLLGINREFAAFAEKINVRSQTTENLALGSQARGLRDSIARAALATRKIPVTANMGTGGKALDDMRLQSQTGYDEALENYEKWASKVKGDEKFADSDIPDPIGFKLVEWGCAEPGELVFVPDAGNGTVAKYVSKKNRMFANEANGQKFATLAMDAGFGGHAVENVPVSALENRRINGDVVIARLNQIPLAVAKVEDCGRIVALLKDSERAAAAPYFKNSWREKFKLRAIIKMPESLMQTDGQKMQVLIYDVRKGSGYDFSKELRESSPETIDLSDIALKDDFYKKLRNISIPKREIDNVARILKRVNKYKDKLSRSPYIIKSKGEESGKHVGFVPENIYAEIRKANKSRYRTIKIHKLRMWGEYDGVGEEQYFVIYPKRIEDDRSYREGLAKVWCLYDDDLEAEGDEALRKYCGYDTDFDNEKENIRDQIKIFRDLIKDAFALNELQIRNIAEGKIANAVPTGVVDLAKFRNVFDMLNANDVEQKDLADKVFTAAAKIPNMPVKIVPKNEMPEDSRNNTVGCFWRSNRDGGTGILYICDEEFNSTRLKDDFKAQTVVHELIHALTCYAIDSYKNEDDSWMPEVQRKAVKSLLDVYKKVIEDSDLRVYLRQHTDVDSNAEYGTNDESELIAELANPKLRAGLRRMKLWRETINNIEMLLGESTARELGVDTESNTGTTAYKELYDALNTLMDNFNPGQYYRNLAEAGWRDKNGNTPAIRTTPRIDDNIRAAEKKVNTNPKRVDEDRAATKGNTRRAGEYVVDRLKKAGIEVSTDKEEFEKAKDGDKLTTSKGKLYGFVKDGKIHLDPDILDANTPCHEYTHLWDKALQKSDPKKWEEGKKLLKQLPLWEEVKNDPNYKDIADDEDKLASEVHSRLVGEKGRDVFEEMLDDARKTKGIFEKAEKYDVINRVRRWVNDAVKWLKDKVFGEKEMSLDDFVKAPIKDLLEGKELKVEKNKEAQKRVVINENEDSDVVTNKDGDSDLIFDEDIEEENPEVEKREKKESAWSKLMKSIQEANIYDVEARKRVVDNLAKMVDSNKKLTAILRVQRDYDRNTVANLADQATELLNDISDTATKNDIKNLINVIRNGINAQAKEARFAGLKMKVQEEGLDANVKKAANQLIRIMQTNNMRRAKNLLDSILKMKGTKLDEKRVIHQKDLDVEGQNLMRFIRDGIKMDEKKLDEALNESCNDLNSDDVTVAKEAEIKAKAYDYARMYKKFIQEYTKDVQDIRDEISRAKKRKDPEDVIDALEGELRDAHEEATNKILELVGQLTDELGESAKRAKDFVEAQREIVDKIHHIANSDTQSENEDVDNEHARENATRIQRFVNNPIFNLLTSSLHTFDQMLRMLGKKAANGEGYLWNYFMNGYIKASVGEGAGIKQAQNALDAKAAEVFGKKGMKWDDLFSLTRQPMDIPLEFKDGKSVKPHRITQGNGLYVYVVNKMNDGKVKLRKMGISEEDVEHVKKALDPRLVKLADWVQSDFFKSLRNKYNAVHERMFGASMSKIENYFPLRINSRSRIENVDIGETFTGTQQPSVVTGGIRKRTHNSYALDILNTDAMDVVLAHINEMEHWANFAEYGRDINTLLSYRKFKNRVMNMTTMYGSGDRLWANFKKVASLAGGVDYPEVGKHSIDTYAVNIAKGVTRAQIAFRLNTALKQVLSAPAFAPYARADEAVKAMLNPKGCWNWAMENLPLFEKRWRERQMGDTRLMQTESDWNFWHKDWVEKLNKWGMAPNVAVDGLTIAVGTKAVYETYLRRYLDYGYSEERAKEKALKQASVIYNESQQSSENMFVAPIQVARTALAATLTTFRNAPQAYGRRVLQSAYELYQRTNKGYKDSSIEFMTKQYLRDMGHDPETATNEQWDRARYAATKDYKRQGMKDAVTLLTFAYLVPTLWNMGSHMAYYILGDDNKKKLEFLKHDATMGLWGGIEGLVLGNVLSETVVGGILTGVNKPNDVNYYNLPLVSSLANLGSYAQSDGWAAANTVVNFAAQAYLGVNPQVVEDTALAIYDACGQDNFTMQEFCVLFSRIIQAPQNQINQLCLDELGMSAKEAQEKTPDEVARAYAVRKLMRQSFLTQGFYGEDKKDDVLAKYYRTAQKLVKERLGIQGDEKITNAYNKYYDTYNKINKSLNSKKTLGKSPDKIMDSPEYIIYDIIKKDINDKKGGLPVIIKDYLDAKTLDKAAEYMQEAIEAKKALVEEIDAELEKEKSSNASNK